jgi:hypothetical protein
MDRHSLILAALAAGGENASFTPVQVQKLFFLLDREGRHLVDGPHFSFAPYDYGPFDRAVYDELDVLAHLNLVRIQSTGRYRVYTLTQAGFQQGARQLGALQTGARSYLHNLASWVRQLSFEQLVAAIYNRYPEMKVNSIFRG